MSPAEKSFEEFRNKLEQLEKLFPGVLKDPELRLQQIATSVLLRECVPESLALIAAKETLPIKPALREVDPVVSILTDENEEWIDLNKHWEQNYNGDMQQKGTLQNACKMAYKGAFGELPPQKPVAVKTSWGTRKFDAYFYPKKWLTEFLISQREDFPYHWSKCSD